MNKKYSLIILSILITVSYSCGEGSGPSRQDERIVAGREQEKLSGDLKEPLTFSEIVGEWELKYGTEYGYRFNFSRNYKSFIILYLKQSSIVFKGVYTLEESNRIRVNIVEMKFAGSPREIYRGKGFTRTKRSYFIFDGYIKKRKRKRSLVMKPVKIIIDGKSSSGYFEPVIKLKMKKRP